MRSTAARVALLAALAAVAIVLFIVLSGGDDEDSGPTTAAPPTAQTTSEAGAGPSDSPPRLITVRDGAPVGGVQRLTYDKGDPVVLEVQLDRPEESIHVHGYEIERPADTSTVRLDFVADIDGIFEVEVHEPGGGEFEIAELRVNP
jgi:hypothetical protein